jgi:hypothetical protein
LRVCYRFLPSLRQGSNFISKLPFRLKGLVDDPIVRRIVFKGSGRRGRIAGIVDRGMMRRRALTTHDEDPLEVIRAIWPPMSATEMRQDCRLSSHARRLLFHPADD